VRTVSVALTAPNQQPLPLKPAPYTVRLVFSDPDGLTPGERIFDIAIQGRKVEGDFDVAKAAGGPRRSVVREFRGIPVQDVLRIELKPSPGCQAPTALCGVEAVAQDALDSPHSQASVIRRGGTQ
jgi:hypothetical protein